MEGFGDSILYIIMGFNALIGIINRILQICYYCMRKNKFKTTIIKETCLTFCLLPTLINIFMISLYLILHREEKMTFSVKVKNFFFYVISCEFLIPFGVHISFKSKYSLNAEDPLITMRLINAIHFLFVSLPQLLIVSINSSAKGEFKAIDISSLVFSCLFFVWSIGYYFICISNGDDFEKIITNFTYSIDVNKLE